MGIHRRSCRSAFRKCSRCAKPEAEHRIFTDTNGVVRPYSSCRECEALAAKRRVRSKPFGSEWVSWRKMHERCSSPKAVHYSRYGGRGIKICVRWSSFKNFLKDMGAKPTAKHWIERINNDGNYTPNNCRWATRAEQGQNQSTNHKLSYMEQTLTIAEWSRRTGIRSTTIRMRLKANWSVADTLSAPVARTCPPGPRNKNHFAR